MLSRPMLAATLEDVKDVRFPVCAQPKLDGVRCLTMGGYAFTRALKLVPNLHVQACLRDLPTGLDGELVCGTFNGTQSAVMSADGKPEFTYHVFDWYQDMYYKMRIQKVLHSMLPHPVVPVTYKYVHNVEELLEYETLCLSQGYEGVMLRDPQGPYKCGRSTLKEGWLLKWKRYKDAEAIIIGFLEQQENTNPQEPDAFGYMKRPGGRANHMPKDTLGSLLLKDSVTNQEFRAGSGFSDEERVHIWTNKSLYLGRTVTYRFQELGPNGRPRFPRIVGFRHD